MTEFQSELKDAPSTFAGRRSYVGPGVMISALVVWLGDFAEAPAVRATHGFSIRRLHLNVTDFVRTTDFAVRRLNPLVARNQGTADFPVRRL